MDFEDVHILISGIQGLGVEIAKNLIIAGVTKITLHDENSVEWWDMSGSFAFSEADLDPHDLKPTNSRYDAQVSVFGARLLKKLEQAKVLIVGSGALGCECLKIFALMGACCDQGGKVTITDDAFIRDNTPYKHLMFRDHNCGQPKSMVAVSAASLINHRLHAEALQSHLCPDTENLFSDEFWEGLTIVFNTSNTLTNSVYVGEKCLYFEKALVDAKFFGPVIMVRTIIPHITDYLFPEVEHHHSVKNIDACIKLAVSKYTDLIGTTAIELSEFVNDPLGYIIDRRDEPQALKTFKRVCEGLDYRLNKTFRDCVTWARCKFEINFANRIKFSVDDPTDMNFIKSASVLRARYLGIDIPEWAKSGDHKFIEAMEEMGFINNDEEDIAPITSDEARMVKLIRKLIENWNCLPEGYMVSPFNVDILSNDEPGWTLMTSLVNLLARNYGFPELHPVEVKFAVETELYKLPQVSPAIASGLACLELYKHVDRNHKYVNATLDLYVNATLDLYNLYMSFSTPVPAPIIATVAGMDLTAWDKWVMERKPTLGDLVYWLSLEKLTVIKVHYGCYCIYDKSIPEHKLKMEIQLLDLMRDIDILGIPVKRRYKLLVSCEDSSNARADIPVFICNCGVEASGD